MLKGLKPSPYFLKGDCLDYDFYIRRLIQSFQFIKEIKDGNDSSRNLDLTMMSHKRGRATKHNNYSSSLILDQLPFEEFV
jgi:hypothetical protein